MLEEKLKALAQNKGIYPFHMPGHKRNEALFFENPYRMDITEIEDFDNLHNAEGILKEEQEKAAALYGSKQCYYLVNGSTCGILSAISSVTGRQDKILVARNCHKAVYHALDLRQLSAEYVYPCSTKNGLQGQILPKDVEELLDKHKEIKVVVITSPTYDGVVSDIAAIAKLIHERDGILIVDEAHGAHFGFHPAFPENAARLGADLVIMSVHKTLPAFTQTALLHCCSDRVDLKKLAYYLSVYETSSPSYLLMAGISRCMQLMREPDFSKQMEQYHRWLLEFRQQAKALRYLQVLGAESFSKEEAFDFDLGKLIISTANCNMNGEQLKEVLLSDYGLQMEMASGDYVLAMTAFCDTKEGFKRLLDALFAIDLHCGEKEEKALLATELYERQKKRLEIYEALEKENESVRLEDAVQRVVASTISLYPPGIPMFVPGEVLSQRGIKMLEECRRRKLEIEGLSQGEWIDVVK